MRIEMLLGYGDEQKRGNEKGTGLGEDQCSMIKDMHVKAIFIE